MLALLLTITPALAQLAFITRYGLSVPVWEHWPFMHQWNLFLSGCPWLPSLFVDWGGHHPAFSMFVFLMLGRLTGFDVKFDLYFGWLIVVALLLVIYSRVLKSSDQSGLTLVVASFILFSARPSELWLDGWDAQFFMVVLEAAIVCVLLSSHMTVARFVSALVVSVLAAFTWGGGIMVFAAGFVILFFTWGRRNILLLAWLALGALTQIALMLLSHTHLPSVLDLVSLDRFLFFATLISNGLLETTNPLIGLIIVTLLALVVIGVFQCRLVRQQEARFWIGMIVFALGVSAIITAVRGQDLGNALLSRYAFISAIVPLGLLGLLAVLKSFAERGEGADPGTIVKIARIGFVPIAALFLVGVIRGEYQLASRVANWQAPRDALEHFVNRTPYLATPGQFYGIVYSDFDYIYRGLAIMRSHGVGIFRGAKDDTAVLLPPPAGTPDATADERFVLAVEVIQWDLESHLLVSGWALDFATMKSPQFVFLRSSGRIVEMALTGMPRPDVAQSYGATAATHSGWRILVPAREASGLQNSLTLVLVGFDGTWTSKEVAIPAR